MANMDGFGLDYGCNGSHDEVPALEQSLSQDPALMGFSDSHVANYDFSAMLHQDSDLALANFDRIPGTQAGLEGRLSNVMLNYDSVPSSGASMSLSLDNSNAFTYAPTTYPAASMSLAPPIDQSQLHPTFSPFSQPLPPAAPYLQQQPTLAARNEQYNSASSTTRSEDSGFSRASERSQAPARQSVQERARQPPFGPPSSLRGSQPVAIQPKKPVVAKANSPGFTTSDAGNSEHVGIYSGSGFDILGILSRVAARPNPQINIGPVDLSCAFVLCDITKTDSPIVYVSDAFERLTGYTKDEIVGRNCRFLQDPEGRLQAGAKRSFVDPQTVLRLRSTIKDRSEIQASIINYRKGGQPFMNLITMIPIRWNTDEYQFYVGFQVDLVEKPDAITRRNADGTYSINYQRDQLPKYVVPPPEIYRLRPDLTTRFDHDEVAAILNAAGVPGSNLSRDYLDRILVENADDVIHVLSFNCEFLYLSPSCKKILEYDPIELVGKTLSAICHPSDIGTVIRDIRASTTPAPISLVYRIRQKYRGYIWLESHGAWHIDPNQGRKYLVMTGRPRPVYSLDQIARLGSSAALAENDIWAKISLSGVVLFVTSKAKPVLGRTPDDLIGKSLHELMEPETTEASEITEALEAAVSSSTSDDKHSDEKPPPTFLCRMQHKKGHSLSALTTIYAGDPQNGSRSSFLVAQIRFARSTPPPAAAVLAAEDENMAFVSGSARPNTLVTKNSDVPRQYGALGQRPADLALTSLDGLPTGNRSLSPSDPATLFTELNPTRGSNWQIELRELEKQNRTLSEELQRLLSQRKKRKRKQSAISVEKSCAMCHTKNTPEWRRGPSGNRDLCNSCGLRWAKQVRNQGQTASKTTATETATTTAPAQNPPVSASS